MRAKFSLRAWLRRRWLARAARHTWHHLHLPREYRWIDLDKPHDISCRKHRNRLARPTFAYITRRLCVQYGFGVDGCEVHDGE